MDAVGQGWLGKPYDSPVAMGHPMGTLYQDGTFTPHGELGGVEKLLTSGWGMLPSPQTALQDKLIREREQEIVEEEIGIKKPANPKQAFGDKKPPLHLIHMIAQLHESAALHSGRRKYGENNYLASEVEAMTYVGAMLRHINQWVSGERVDRKELVHHLGAVRACTNILLSAEACGMLIDNRPCVGPVEANCYPGPQSYQVSTELVFNEVSDTIEHLNKLYPNPA